MDSTSREQIVTYLLTGSMSLKHCVMAQGQILGTKSKRLIEHGFDVENGSMCARCISETSCSDVSSSP
jgi:hypothetical protein